VKERCLTGLDWWWWWRLPLGSRFPRVSGDLGLLVDNLDMVVCRLSTTRPKTLLEGLFCWSVELMDSRGSIDQEQWYSLFSK